MAYKVLLVGGGTGGHVFPLVAVHEALRDQSHELGVDLQLRFMGHGPVIREQAEILNVPFSPVLASKWRRYFSVLNIVDFFKFPFAFIQTFVKVWVYMPDVIFSKGGYAGFLPVLCGWLMRIPVYTHESDTIPGKANAWSARFAKVVFTSFEMTTKHLPKDKAQLVGSPLRKDALQITEKLQALQYFEFDDSKPTIFITGANQGAQGINDTIILGLIQLVQRYHIIHQCGARNYEDITKRVQQIIDEEDDKYDAMIKNGYHVYPALTAQQMGLAYSASDIVISRSGGNVHEIAMMGKPAIVVPLPTSSANHQYYNAQELVKHGAILIEEQNFTPHLLISQIERLYANRVKAADSIRAFARPDAARTIAQALLSLR